MIRAGVLGTWRRNGVFVAAAIVIAAALQSACQSDSNTVTGSSRSLQQTDATSETAANDRTSVMRARPRQRTPIVAGRGGSAPTPTPTSPGQPTAVPTVPGFPTATPPSGPTATPPPTATPRPTNTPTPGTGPAVTVRLRAVSWQWDFVQGPTISKNSGYPGQNTITIRVGQRITFKVYNGGLPGSLHIFSGVGSIGLSGAALSPGDADSVSTFTATAAGTYEFSCTESGCGTGHDRMHGFIVITP